MTKRRQAFTSWVILVAVVTAGCGASRRPSPSASVPTVDLSAALGVVLRAEDLRRQDLVSDDVLGHEEPAVRSAAIRALGRIGDPRSTAAIQAHLSDPEPSVRAAAIAALARVDPTTALDRLAALSTDPAAEVRAAVATAGGVLEPGSTAAIVRILLDDVDPEVRGRAAASAALASANRSTVERLAVVAGGPASRMAAVIALADIARPGSAAGRGPEGFLARRAARDQLLELASDRSSEVRAQVARGLAIPSSTDDTTALVHLADDHDAVVRIRAIRSLTYPGSPLTAIAEARIGDPDPVVRLTLYEALGALRSERLTIALAAGLRNDRSIAWVVAGALGSLYRAAPDAAMESATGIASHPAPEVRAAMCRALAEVSVFTAPAIHDVVRSMAVIDVPEVREAAVESLQAFGISLTDFPDEVLGSEDPRVRTGLARAAEAWLRSTGAARPAGPALDVLELLDRRVPDDTSVRAQAALIDAASAARDDTRAHAILESRSRAGAPALRRRARAALGDNLQEPETDAAVPDPQPYAEIARWASVPRAAIVRVQRPGFTPGRFTMALDVRSAPLATHAFARAVEEGRFNGIEFGSLVPGSRILAGDPADATFDRVDNLVRDEPFDGPFPSGSVLLEGVGPDLATGALTVTLAPRSTSAGQATRIGLIAQNFDGVVRALLPGDRILDVTIYEGDGSEPLPSIE